MAYASAYVVVYSERFQIKPDAGKVLRFNLSDMVSSQHAILGFKYRDNQVGLGANLEVQVNDYKVGYYIIRKHHSVDISYPSTLWDSFEGHYLKSNSDNSIEFRLVAGSSANIDIEDVVLWYTRNL